MQRVFALTYAPVTDGRAAGFSKGFFDHQSSGHRKTPLFATNARWASEIEEGAIDESESGMLDKNYFGPVYPEAPKFKDPQDDLLEIGIYIRFEFKTRTSPEKEQEVVRIKGEHLAIPFSAEYLMHEAMHGGSNREELS